ncbi:MAG TPA: hypothetical protein VJR89_18595 [Polyangiales bacterium]|nr:hypothetical protein [Polyangiales bacterium]
MQLFVWVLLFTAFAGEIHEPDFTYAGMAQYSAILGMLAASASVTFWLIAVRPNAADEARIAASGLMERDPPPEC